MDRDDDDNIIDITDIIGLKNKSPEEKNASTRIINRNIEIIRLNNKISSLTSFVILAFTFNIVYSAILTFVVISMTL